MRRRRVEPIRVLVCVVLGAAALVGGCASPAPQPPREDAGHDARTTTGANPPGPPTPRELDPDVASALPRTDDGLPILISTGTPGPDGYQLSLAYDATRDDPVSRWTQCLGRVTACYHANPGAPILGCLTLVERCDGASGGFGCCPTACIEAVNDAVSSGMSEADAIDSVLLAGDCVEGFAAVRDAAYAEGAP